MNQIQIDISFRIVIVMGRVLGKCDISVLVVVAVCRQLTAGAFCCDILRSRMSAAATGGLGTAGIGAE